MTPPASSAIPEQSRPAKLSASARKKLQDSPQIDLFSAMGGSDAREAMVAMDRADEVVGRLDKVVAQVTAANPELGALAKDGAADVSMAMYLRSGGASLESVNELITSTSSNPTAVMAVFAIADATDAAAAAYKYAGEALGADFALRTSKDPQAGDDAGVKTPAKRGRKKKSDTGTPAAPLTAEESALAEQNELTAEADAEESESAFDGDESVVDEVLGELTPREAVSRESKRDKLESARAMQGILNRIGSSRYDPPTPEQEYALGMRVRAGDDAARTELMERNTRYLVRTAARFTKTGRKLDELFQAGSFGLIRAVELFEPEKGFRFTTYADAWIRQHISRFVTNDVLIRTPMHVVDKEMSIRKRSREASADGNLDLSTSLERQADEMLKDRPTAGSFTPLDSPLGDDDDRTLQDLLASEDVSLEQATEAKKLVGWLLRAANNTDNPVHGEIFKMRLGLHPDYENDPLTLLEISEIFEISRERVRQIFEKSLLEIAKNVTYWAKGVENLPHNFFPQLKATYGRS